MEDVSYAAGGELFPWRISMIALQRLACLLFTLQYQFNLKDDSTPVLEIT
jgi:hypothetical protein